jgi:hypothetical protein
MDRKCGDSVDVLYFLQGMRIWQRKTASLIGFSQNRPVGWDSNPDLP